MHLESLLWKIYMVFGNRIVDTKLFQLIENNIMNKDIMKIFTMLFLILHLLIGCKKDDNIDYRKNIVGQYQCQLIIEENRYSNYIHDTTSITTTSILIQSYLDSLLLISDPILYSGQADTVKVKYSTTENKFIFYSIRNGFDVGYYNFIYGSILDLPTYTNEIHVRPPIGPAFATYFYYGTNKIIQ
ncbi:MAG: hypothetical protein WCP57_07745 [Bacteroidota bacterium]